MRKFIHPPYSTTAPTAPLGFDSQHQQIPLYPMNQGLQQPPFQQYDNRGQPPPLNAYNAVPTVPVTYFAQPQQTIVALNSTPRAYQPIPRFGITNRKHQYIALGIFGGIFLVMVIIGIVIGVVVSRDISESNRRHEEFRKKLSLS
ncbi:hypothetical protein PPYR_08666 [Photinus pyralis]|uniref:Uncharacterized protein n=1 Tax=Photinus pyralis TaxID=7054 RepID=A0A5N4AK66_PHOPY|nr:hypothetical protein PPYR_08666 [Photinus pyralis]